jgi:hypothetical protein
MKLTLPLCLTILLIFSLDAKANYGCNTGNVIYPSATGRSNSYGDPYYYSATPITIRWWDQDPNCGILSSKIRYRTNGDDNCQIQGTNSWGIVYYYNPADNNCVPLPLDDYIPLLVLLTALTGGYFIRNSLSRLRGA